MTGKEELILKCTEAALKMRENALKLAHSAGANGAHLGSGLSIIEIMATLYCGIMNYDVKDPSWDNRDRFILSKGHGTLGYYTALCAAGIITEEQLFTFEQNGGDFPGQPSKNMELGIEYSSGSLGIGLSYAIGLALAGKWSAKEYKTFILMGDGELNEGTVWESAMFASHLGLSNLVAIIDTNGMQSDGRTEEIMSLNLYDMWSSFGWEVLSVEDGHNIEKLYDSFTKPFISNKPRVIIAKTIKGKGVSFMENNNEWHHHRLTDEQYNAAMSELAGKVGQK